MKKGALAEVMKFTEIFWKRKRKMFVMQSTRKNQSLHPDDLEKLIKRQGLITRESLAALMEQLLPMEMWSIKTFPELARNLFPSFTAPFFDIRLRSFLTLLKMTGVREKVMDCGNNVLTIVTGFFALGNS